MVPHQTLLHSMKRMDITNERQSNIVCSSSASAVDTHNGSSNKTCIRVVLMEWWIVYYGNQTIPGMRGGSASSAIAQYVIVQAANSSDAESKAHVSLPILSTDGPFSTKAKAQAAATKSHKTVGQAAPNIKLPNVLSGIDAIGNFFNKLGEKELWIRVAEVVLGLLMIGVALGKLSGIDAKITKAVNTAVKVA